MRVFRFSNAIWFEAGAGLVLLVHAVTAYGTGTSMLPMRLGVPAAIVAVASIFLSHLAIRFRWVRRILIIVGAAGFAVSVADAVLAKDAVTALLFAVWGMGLLLSEGSVTPEGDHEASDKKSEPPDMTAIVAGASLLGIGTLFTGTGLAPEWFAPHHERILFGGGAYLLTAFLFVLTGIGLLVSELGSWKARAKVAFRTGSSLLPLLLAGNLFLAGAYAVSSVFALVAVLLIGARFGEALRIEPEGLEKASFDESTIFGYERIGQIAIWTIVIAIGFFIAEGVHVSVMGIFASMGIVTLVILVYYYLAPIHSYTERNYLISTLAETVAFCVLWWTAGGLDSPFTLLSFIIILAALAVLSSVAVAGFSLLIWLVPLADVLTGRIPVSGGNSVFITYTATLIILTLVAFLMAERQKDFTGRLRDATKATKEALRTEEGLRDRFKEKAENLEKVNRELRQMRSALLNVLEDVEESKSELESEHRREAAVFSSLGEAVIAADRDGQIILVNDEALEMLSLAREKLIGETIERAVRLHKEGSDVQDTTIFTAAFGGKATELKKDLLLIDSEGGRTPVEGNARPFLDDEDRLAGIVVVLRDVTAEWEIDQEKSNFVTVASHQLRTPVNAVRWYADLLLDGDAGRVTKVQKEYLTDMRDSVVRMAKLIDDLLQVSRAEEGKVQVAYDRTDLPGFIDSFVKEVGPAFEEKHQTLSVEVADRIPSVRTDKAILWEILENLVTNAHKYTQEKGHIVLRVRSEGKSLVFEIEDDGAGIAKEHQHHIFEKFYRGATAMTQETKGSGIGLYVSKLNAELLGGDISFESTEGKGTVFRLVLPIQDKGRRA